MLFQKNKLVKYGFLCALMAAGLFFLEKEDFSSAETSTSTATSVVNNTSSVCLQDNWSCGNWGECIGGFQARFCENILDCPNITSVSPATKQSCTAVAASTTTSTVVNYCQYDFSEYGACENGKQYRKIISRLPEGCIDKTIESLERSCTASEILKTCLYSYSDWSSCLNGKKTRSLISVSLDCLPGNPILEEKCEPLGSCTERDWRCGEWSSCISSTKQYRNCSLAYDCVIVPETKPLMARECSASANISISQENTSSSGPGGQFGQNNQSQTAIDPAVRQFLSDYSGYSAIADPENKSLSVNLDENGTSSRGETGVKEIKIEGFPLAFSGSKISVILSPMAVADQQQILSPVAIVFDANKNGIPDDTEKRMNIVPIDVKLIDQKELSFLSGIDQALINGKPLEQPKLSDGLKESKLLTVNSIETVQIENTGIGSILRIQGKAEPNQVVTLFIYSVMPIVLTAKADAYGNWIYDLDKSLVDGKHEIYAAVNNSEGRIIAASLPTPFFIQEAKAVTIGDFIGIQKTAAVPDASNNMINFYLAGGIVFIFLLIAGFLFIRKKSLGK